MKKYLLKALIFCLLFLSIIFFTSKVTAEAPELTPEERYEQALNDWSDKLGECESENDPKAINLKDSDGKPKFGYHQYMPSTFIDFAKKYKVYPDINVDTAFTYMMSKEKTTHLTMEVMRQNPKEFSHWGKTCRNFAGNPPVLEDFIK